MSSLGHDPPSVSVIIPVYNDPEGIRTTLESLLEQTYPTNATEIVVVDNGSDDETRSVVRTIAADHPDRIRLETEFDTQGSYAARNTGIRESDGDYLAFIDADVVADSDWLEAAVAATQNHGVDYVGSRVEIERNGETFAGLYNELTGFPVERYIERNEFAPTCALVVARDVISDVGEFDAELVSGGDTEFGQRVAAAGYDLHYEPTARVIHPARTSLRSLLEKYVRIGRGIAQRQQKYPERYETLSLWNPLTYVPPHPLRFHRNFGDEWDDLSYTDKLGLYGVGSLRRLASAAGRLATHLESDSSSSADDLGRTDERAT
ncbi:glycosyltransferase [Natronolimnobius sp. AArcel1]|uniref:glycosyltransferase n=1 Tax=Natronolimnobius sp. AArcel1 TaxID=1679093 RepID=UPI0013EA0128|nr:glycosyltransferase [Natronolimnobius sp. AArcel1]NGM68570.1 glycosyltransferase [Natronolimnobius sp. AArcel1]